MTYVLVCHREMTPEFAYWPSRAQAEQASAELAPCSRRCTGCHTIVACVPPGSPPPQRD